MMTVTNLTDLLLKHLHGNLSEQEQQALDQWIAESARNRRFFESVDDEEQLRLQLLAFHQEEMEDNEALILSKIRQRIGAGIPAKPVRSISPVWRWSGVAAASVLLAVAVGAYMWSQKEKTAPAAVAAHQPEILPAKMARSSPSATAARWYLIAWVTV
ncbi:hypothetical protein MKQ70_26920 [Chitinophaga sedimenti]|uniref:hypothetical protein n=1 Tax=Chitinophaga sedimenti TaxID=2033606 RepID=UPI0020055236|nr:hypothetical protein [Chitinophaga sedimenti]MCK7558433.1 hypothetical protein [Chitinophaga sedimenti]